MNMSRILSSRASEIADDGQVKYGPRSPHDAFVCRVFVSLVLDQRVIDGMGRTLYVGTIELDLGIAKSRLATKMPSLSVDAVSRPIKLFCNPCTD